MPNGPFGYGDANGQGDGGYGKHSFGFGHPFHVLALTVEGGPFREDLGGDTLNFDTGGAGTLPTGAFQVRIGGETCYSGVMGQGSDVYADSARQRFSCVMPHLFGTTGPVDVEIVHSSGNITFTGAITVVKHVGRTTSTLHALLYPREVFYLPIPVPRP